METALIQRVVKVTSEHIERGVPCSSYACPLAQALQEAYGWADVGSHSAALGGRSVDRDYILSFELVQWIAAFDHRAKAEPIEVAVDADNYRMWIVPQAPADAHWTAEGRLEWEDTQADPRDQAEPHSVFDLADDGVGL